MKKIIVVIMLVIGMNLAEVKAEEKAPVDLRIKIMQEKEKNGKYEYEETYEIPKEGYNYNEEKSKCQNGSTLAYNKEDVEVVTKGQDICYAYFDIREKKPIKVEEDLLNSNPKTGYVLPITLMIVISGIGIYAYTKSRKSKKLYKL